MKNLEGTAKRNVGIISIVLAIAIGLYIITPILAVSFTANEENQPTFIVSTIRTLNISVNNTNTTANITNVGILLPSGMIFIEGSNSTSVSFTNFSNTTNSVSGDIEWLNWTNFTDFVVQNGTTEYFIFKVYMPSSSGNKTITVYTNDTSNIFNSTTINITVSGLSSTTNNFSAFQEEALFNWTQGNLTIEVNVNGTQVRVENTDTNITPHYFLSSQAQYAFDGPYLTASQWNTCFQNNMEFAVRNSTEDVNSTSGFLNETQTVFFSTHINDFCPPGLYKGTFYVRNTSDSSDNIQVPVTIHSPISVNNTFTEPNNTGFFTGSNTSGGDHSYYFFTNITQNITGVTINISGLSTDMDLFLLDSSGTLLEKAIKTGSSNEEVFRFLPSTVDTWEVRLSTVISSYTGYLYFTTLNVTNTTNSDFGVSNLTFGSSPLKPNETNTTTFGLENIDSQSVDNVQQSFEIYRIKKFLNFNTPQQFELLVPHYATKLKIRLEWNNESDIVTDWDLFLRDNTGRFIANSTNKSAIANFTNLIREEFITYTGPFNTTFEDFWNITVLNQTNDTLNFYNVTALIFFDETLWIDTNFTQLTDFNTTGGINSSYNFTANVTVPRFNVLNGSYEGFITYTNGSGWILKIPFFFDLHAGHLLINNTLRNNTFRAKENVGFNRTVNMSITFNNTGGFPIHFTNTTSGLALFLTTSTSIFANFTIDNPVPNPINADTGGIFNIIIVTNASNTAGLYQGWILFNSTNTTLDSSSYPYQRLNLTLDLNLTDRLNASLISISTGESNPIRIENTSKNTNITLTIDVRLLNGTVISETDIMGITNFTSATIIENNFTASTSTATATLTNRTEASAGPACGTSPKTCNINFTVPSDLVGGRYTVFVPIEWNTSNLGGTGSLLKATAFNTTLIVNNAGINMSAPQSKAIGDIDEATGVKFFNVTVGNLGPLQAGSVDITLNKGVCPVTITHETSSALGPGTGCSSIGGTSSATYTITINPYTPIEKGCSLRWKIAATNVSGTTACTGANALNVTANNASFNNITGITLTVVETGGGGGDGDGDGSGGGGITCSIDADCPSSQYCSGSTCTALSCESHEYIESHACVAYAPTIAEYESSLSVLFGESNSTTVLVNETNSKTITAALNVTLSDQLEVTVTPGTCTTPCTFTVNFSTTNTTEILIYEGTFKAFYSVFPVAFQEKSFSVKVLPTEEQKAGIEQNYLNYLPLLDSLTQEFESLKALGIISEGNLTLLQSLIDSMHNLSTAIQAALDEGDYTQANSLLSELNTTISQIQSTFSEFGPGTGVVSIDTITWIIVGIIVAGIIIFLVYLLLPPKEYPPPFKPKKTGLIDRVKGLLKRKKKESTPTIKKYATGYKRQKSFTYKKQKNPFKLFKKKKQRKLKEFSKA